jgi:hypothetical protein
VYSDAMGVSSVGDNIRSIDLIGEVWGYLEIYS